MLNDQTSGKRDYGDVPADYPHAAISSSLAGAHPKLALVEFAGKYYIPGDTPEERLHDWLYSESMVQHFLAKCPETKRERRSHMSEVEIIAQYFERAVAAGGHYGTDAQLQWTFRRVAQLLGWPVPDVCKEQGATS
jgi:hypothetical protein